MKKQRLLLIALVASLAFLAIQTIRLHTMQRYRLANNNKTEIVKQFHQNGKLASFTEIQGGQRNGVSLRYAEDGSLISVETYRSGKRHGACIYFLPGGGIKHGGYWEDDHPYDATYTQYHDTSTNLYISETFRGGKRCGFRHIWYKDGRKDIVPYENGLEQGLAKEFGRNGILQCERDYVNGVEVRRRTYDMNGQLDAEYATEYRVPGKARLRVTCSRNGEPFAIYEYGPDNTLTNTIELSNGVWVNKPTGNGGKSRDNQASQTIGSEASTQSGR